MIARLTAAGALALLAPTFAWHVADDGVDPVAPAAPTTTTTTLVGATSSTTTTTTTGSTTVAAPDESTTTSIATTDSTATAAPDGPTVTTTTTTTTTTTIPARTTANTTIPAITATSTPPAEPATTIAPTAPAPETTAPPPTTEVPAPSTPPPVPVPPRAPVTRPPTPPAPRDDIETAPVVEPPEPPSGRRMESRGVAEGGDQRPVVFPVAGPIRYGNDFGACRDGCRRQHKGNDLIGDRLQPLLAMHDGVVDRLLDHPTAGYGIVIRDGEGWEYHIYHVNNDTPGTDDGADEGGWRFTPGIAPGSPVKAGEVIAWMGDSGNSEGSVPHAHVEIHTPDGRAINPYWSLRLAQRDANCAIAAPTAEAGAPTAVDGLDPAALPGDWTALEITGGRPGSGRIASRMWIGPAGFTPIDAAAVRVGDARYDGDCAELPPEMAPAAVPAELGSILATIRFVESWGDYTAESRSSTASGAYQFLDSSWAGYGGYRRARDAPPPVQDAKAVELVNTILRRNNGDVSTIPVTWYIGHVPRGAEWDQVPTVGKNTLTPREYQARWLAVYDNMLASPTQSVGAGPPWTKVDTAQTCRTVVIDVGPPGHTELALTQTATFAVDTAGRAVAPKGDPCDPNPTIPTAPAAAEAIARLGGPR